MAADDRMSHAGDRRWKDWDQEYNGNAGARWKLMSLKWCARSGKVVEEWECTVAATPSETGGAKLGDRRWKEWDDTFQGALGATWKLISLKSNMRTGKVTEEWTCIASAPPLAVPPPAGET